MVERIVVLSHHRVIHLLTDEVIKTAQKYSEMEAHECEQKVNVSTHQLRLVEFQYMLQDGHLKTYH